MTSPVRPADFFSHVATAAKLQVTLPEPEGFERVWFHECAACGRAKHSGPTREQLLGGFAPMGLGRLFCAACYKRWGAMIDREECTSQAEIEGAFDRHREHIGWY
jgi:hypothetical protein